MRCLLKHKMYSLENAIQMAMFASCGSFLVLSFIAYKMTVLSDIIDFVIAGSCFGLCTVNIQTKQKDEGCQWDKFCFTLPVTRTQVVKSEFISQWFITGITIVLASVFIIIINLIGATISFYQITEVMALLFIMSVLSQSILYLAGIKLGYENVDTLNMIAMGTSIAIYLIPATIIELLAPSQLLEWVMLDYAYRIVICIVGAIISWSCYLYCARLVKQQEF